MIKLNRHYAEVIDINDPDKKGKIKIKILPEFNDMSEDLLPWAKPFITTGMTDKEYDFHPPTVGSKILILTDDKFRTFYYVHGIMIEGLFDYDAIKTKLDTVSEMTDTEYPNVDFTLLNDGSISFYNRQTGDNGFIHNSGTYYIIDSNGYVYLSESSGNKITIDSSGTKLKDKNGNDITMGTTSVTINGGNFEVLQ